MDTEEGAAHAISLISAHPYCGYDSEFYGVDIAHESCVGRSILDVFSIATETGHLHSLGYREPTSWVFDGRLINCGPVRAYLEDPSYRKVIHNRPVDEHTAYNAGVRIRGGLCTLNMARFVYPERANLARGNYDLDSICQWRVGRGKAESFDELFGYDAYEPFQVEAEKKWCPFCAELGDGFACKKKKAPHDSKLVRSTIVTRQRRVRRHIQLSDVRPGHPLFERYLRYAAVDAELAVILYQMLLIDGRKERDYPWGF